MLRTAQDARDKNADEHVDVKAAEEAQKAPRSEFQSDVEYNEVRGCEEYCDGCYNCTRRPPFGPRSPGRPPLHSTQATDQV